jgi:hypothetical protein
MCKVRTKKRVVLGMRAMCDIKADHGTQIPKMSLFKVWDSLMKVRHMHFNYTRKNVFSDT